MAYRKPSTRYCRRAAISWFSSSRSFPVLTVSRIKPSLRAASCAPTSTRPAYGVVAISSVIKPRTYDLLVRNVRATEFGLYPIDWAVPRTRCATALLTRLRSLLFMTNDTVQMETPASFAMSLIDTNGFALSAWRLCEADSIVCPPFFGDTLPFSFSRIGCPAAPGHGCPFPESGRTSTRSTQCRTSAATCRTP